MKRKDGRDAVLKDGTGVEQSTVATHANDEVDLVGQVDGRTEHGDLILDGFKRRVVT